MFNKKETDTCYVVKRSDGKDIFYSRFKNESNAVCRQYRVRARSLNNDFTYKVVEEWIPLELIV